MEKDEADRKKETATADREHQNPEEDRINNDNTSVEEDSYETAIRMNEEDDQNISTTPVTHLDVPSDTVEILYGRQVPTEETLDAASHLNERTRQEPNTGQLPEPEIRRIPTQESGQLSPPGNYTHSVPIDLDTRCVSFNNTDYEQHASDLAEAGFYFSDDSKGEIQCFSCGRTLVGGSPDLGLFWERHANMCPSCWLVRKKGEFYFHEQYQDLHQSRQESSACDNDQLLVDFNCKVCFIRTACVLLRPCCHVCVCKECMDNTETCPVCTEPVVSKTPLTFEV